MDKVEKFVFMAKELVDTAEKTTDQVCVWLKSKKAELEVKVLAGDKEAAVHIKTIDHLLATCPKKEAP